MLKRGTSRALGFCAAITLLAGCGANQQQLPEAVQLPVRAEGARVQTGPFALYVKQQPRPATGSFMGWTPADIASAYDLPSATKGKGQVVGIVVAFDNPNVAKDLTTYREEYDLGTAPFHKYNQEGKQKDYPMGQREWGVNTDTLVQTVTAACPNCSIDLVEADNDIAVNEEAAVAEAVKLGAHIIVGSVGSSCEGTSGGDCFDESYFDKPGVLYLAPGDDNVFTKQISIFPADFDSVIAVGSTVLTSTTKGRGYTESVWSYSLGGCVEYDPKPSWQKETSCTNRIADDASIVGVYLAVFDDYGPYGGWIEVSSTVDSAGLLAGAFALAGNETKQDGGKTFWEKKHLKDLYNVCGSKCLFGQYSYGGGWGSPHGLGAL